MICESLFKFMYYIKIYVVIEFLSFVDGLSHID